jgi:hypothetical protein
MKFSPEEPHEDSERIAYWARRVCLEPSDIYDADEEKHLLGKLGNADLESILGFKEIQIEPKRALERSMEAQFLSDFEEECGCGEPFIGLCHDYLEATPLEKAVVNYVLRRLANTTVPRLLSRS